MNCEPASCRNVLHVINALTYGGAQTVVATLAAGLARSGSHPLVAAFRDGPMRGALERAGAEVVILGERGCDVPAALSLARLLRERRPAVIHAHLFRAAAWARLARRQVCASTPLVVSVHGRETPCYHRVERRLATWADVLTFPSQALADWYQATIRRVPAGRRRVIHPGVEPVVDLRADPTGTDFAVGACGRLHVAKGFATLIEAVARCRDAGVPIRLRILGDGREREALVALVARLQLADAVSFLGAGPASAAFFANLVLFAAPSHDEAFGLSAAEAMAHGLPVVVGDVGGLRELVREGTDGWRVRSGDAAALAAVLQEAASRPDERRRRGTCARARIAADFSATRMVAAYEELYDGLNAVRPRRVLVAVSSRRTGGGENLAGHLTRSLGERGWTATCVCGEGKLARLWRGEESGVARLATTHGVSLRAGGLFLGARIGALARRHDVSSMYLHLNRAALVGGLMGRWLGVPTVGHVHGLNRASYYRRADRLVAVSTAVARHLVDQGIAAERVATLPNGIPGAACPRTIEPGPPWVIGVVARFHANKGHAWALAALEQAVDRLPKFELWLFGDGPELGPLRQRFGAGPLAGRLRWWGHRDDLHSFLPRVHWLLLPSLGEGIPLSLLEGFRWGIPCIATRVGGIPELVTPETDGLLVEANDGAGLQRAFAAALDEGKWAELSMGAVASFARVNPYRALVEGVEKLLLSVAGRTAS